MKPKWLAFSILFATYGLVEAHAESDPFSASIYRHQKLENATNCTTPERTYIRPQFHTHDAKRLLDRTIVFGDQVPLSGLDNTFWQLDVSKERLGRSFLSFNCDGEKFFAFQVFRKGSLRPVMIVGVSEKDPSIFDSAQRVTDTQASNFIMGRGELVYVPAMATASAAASAPLTVPVAAAEAPTSPSTQALGVSSKYKVSVEDATVAAQPITSPGVVFKRVAKKTAPSAEPLKQIATSDLMSYYHRATPWSNQRNTFAWTETAVNALTARWSKISQARDLENFCPGYYGVSSEKQMACVLRVFTEMARYESSFNPRPKDFKENNGDVSRGLFSMSLHQCPNARTADELFDPHVNIECAAIVFAKWIAKDGYISGPAEAKGAARNWSCLQTFHYVYAKSLGKSVPVGYKKQIIQFASSYNRVI
jgi:hypothetical protein